MSPQFLEDHLRLAAGIDEDERGLVPLDQIVDLRIGVARGMPGPGQHRSRGRLQHGDMRRGAALRHDEIGEACAVVRLRHEIAAQIVGLGDGRRQADGVQTGRQREQPRKPEREQVAALRGDQRMQFVEDHALQRAEQIRRVGGGEQQRELLRRGQQNVGRIAALARALRDRRVAGAGLDPDRQAHLGDRRFEVARDVDRERLQRRDVERVQALRAADVLPVETSFCAAARRARATRSASAESRPASCRRRSARSAAPSGRSRAARAIRADARAGSSRASANQRAKTSRQHDRAVAIGSRRVTGAALSLRQWRRRGALRDHQQSGHRHVGFSMRVETGAAANVSPAASSAARTCASPCA